MLPRGGLKGSELLVLGLNVSFFVQKATGNLGAMDEKVARLGLLHYCRVQGIEGLGVWGLGCRV